jgi:hypothetical protein
LTDATGGTDSGAQALQQRERGIAVSKRLARLLLALACTVAAAHARAGTDAGDQADTAPHSGNVLTLRKTPSPAADHRPTIEAFVRLAAANDVDGLFKTFGDEPVRANGEVAIRHYLTSEVIPFFADSDRLDTHSRVVSATFEDGTTGLIAYAYVVTGSGRMKPFVVAWRLEDGQARWMDVKVDRCVKARHPVSAGRCDL